MTHPLDLFSPAFTSPAHGTVVSLHRSAGGVPKLEVASARITIDGMAGDRQRNLKHHGGPDRALCLYSLDLMEALRAEGHPVQPGAMGENVLIRGLAWEGMVPGVRLRLGAVEVELTAFAHPCRNISAAFNQERIERVSVKVHPGWSRVYARVIVEGVLASGDPVVVL
jgi:MOSC domain-containing protein YiiM